MEHWKRTLAVSAAGQTLSILGFSFVVPFLPLFIQQLGVHGVSRVTLWAAFLSGGVAICMSISAPFWGVLADRHGRKIMVVRSMFSAAVLIGLGSLVQNVYELLALRMLQGAFTGTVTASQALVASQTPRDRMGFALGVMQTSVFLGNSFGPLAGGVVADSLGFRSSFVAAGCILFLGGLLVTILVHERKPDPVDRSVKQQGVIAGMRVALRSPAMLPVIGVIFAVQFGTSVVFPILPQFVQYLVGPGGHAATTTGFIFTFAGLAGAASSLAIGPVAERIGYHRIIIVASALAAILSVPQFFVNATWQLLVLRVATGFALGALMPAASALIATLVPVEKRGTAYGLAGSATSLGFAAGPLTAAGVVAVADIRTVFLAAAVVLGLIAVWAQVTLNVPEREALTASEAAVEERMRSTG